MVPSSRRKDKHSAKHCQKTARVKSLFFVHFSENRILKLAVSKLRSILSKKGDTAYSYPQSVRELLRSFHFSSDKCVGNKWEFMCVKHIIIF